LRNRQIDGGHGVVFRGSCNRSFRSGTMIAAFARKLD
jgi:hypothetical protein